MRLGLVVPEKVENKFALARSLGAKGIAVPPEEIEVCGGIDNLLKLYKEEGVEVAQIPCWGFNPLIPEDDALELVKEGIALAGEAGPACTVIFGAGGLNPENPWAGHPDNWTAQAREQAAETIRPLARLAEEREARIVFEPHLVNVANNAAACAALLNLIDSPNAGVSLDIANFCTYERYWNTKSLIDDTMETLRGHNCFAAHLKDVCMEPKFIVHLNECAVGKGNMNLTHLLSKLDETLEEQQWAIIEHTTAEELEGAFAAIGEKAREADVTFV